MDGGCARALADRECERDVGIASADGDKAKHVPLSPGQIVRRRRFLRFFSELLPGQADSPAERDQSQRRGMPFRGIEECRGLGLVAGSATLYEHVGIVTSRVLARQYGADAVIHRERLVK